MDMDVCLICSNKKEEFFFKSHTKFEIKYLLSTYDVSPEKNITIDNVMTFSDVIDTFVIGKTKECRSDFIYKILSNLALKNKIIINFHDFSDMQIENPILLNEFKKLGLTLNNIAKLEFFLPIIHKPLILINSVIPDASKLLISCDVNKCFYDRGFKCCIISSDPYNQYIEKVSSVYIPCGDFEHMLVSLIDQFQNIQDSDIIFMVYPFELLSNYGSYNIVKEFYNSLVNRWKADYLITCIPANTDTIQIEKFKRQNFVIHNKETDCFIKVNSIFDPLDYNVKKPCDFMLVKNFETKLILSNSSDEKCSFEAVFDDIVSKLQ